MATDEAAEDRDATGMVLVFTTVPDRDHADRVAFALVEERLAACVSILAPAVSVYRWQGVVETAEELPLMVKTAASRLAPLQRRLLELHPYDLPEIVAIRVADGLPGYIGWVLAESGRPSGGD
jgi:periplasmic divalent cation tolerance protein